VNQTTSHPGHPGDEAEERFHITGSRAIAFTLAGYARDGERFSALFDEQMFLTTLIEVDTDEQELIFDFGGAEALNQRLLRVGHCRLAGRPGGVHVHFNISQIRQIEHEGRPAFAAPLPRGIVRLQRRESFRIDTPRAKPLRFFIRQPEGQEIELPAFDISITGIGLLASADPNLQAGQLLERCRFRLPDDTQDIHLAAQVQHITHTQSRSGARQWRIGVHFLDLSAGTENRLQRYIARLERERNERA
jgi:c-di-GMP-binding flagellar brake protein YcgR